MSEPNRLKVRTTIMLVSMIALPAAAIMGLKWPAFLRSEGVWTQAKSLPVATALGRPSSQGRPDLDGPQGKTKTPVHPQQLSSEPSNYPVIQAENIVVRPEAAILPAVGESPFVPPVTNLAAAAAAQPLEVQTNEEFTRIQQRLRGLGATHYVLETWGLTGEAYRFQCRMAAGHDAHYSRHFEATDVEPLRAMRTVLDDVESWKSGRLP